MDLLTKYKLLILPYLVTIYSIIFGLAFDTAILVVLGLYTSLITLLVYTTISYYGIYKTSKERDIDDYTWIKLYNIIFKTEKYMLLFNFITIIISFTIQEFTNYTIFSTLKSDNITLDLLLVFTFTFFIFYFINFLVANSLNASFVSVWKASFNGIRIYAQMAGFFEKESPKVSLWYLKKSLQNMKAWMFQKDSNCPIIDKVILIIDNLRMYGSSPDITPFFSLSIDVANFKYFDSIINSMTKIITLDEYKWVNEIERIKIVIPEWTKIITIIIALGGFMLNLVDKIPNEYLDSLLITIIGTVRSDSLLLFIVVSFYMIYAKYYFENKIDEEIIEKFKPLEITMQVD